MNPPPLPRLLVIMGSGETSPTMVKTHRSLLERLGPPPVPAVVLDTPFGFQANADELTARALEYFRQSVGAELGVASFRSAAVDALTAETMVNRLRSARYVFAGPGSPSYALRQWDGSPVPAVLAEKLERGGCVTFASAAALTLGIVTVPVYEIYKVGADPVWLDGLDLLGRAGLSAAVIPHYDNAEGGTHDTRYCYLGEDRLRLLESQLPEDAFVLGVDEHTGVVIDLDAGTASVVGRGGLTVRRDGRSDVHPAGSTLALEALRTGQGSTAAGPVPGAVSAAGAEEAAVPSTSSSLTDEIDALTERFDAYLAARDVPGAVAVLLETDQVLVAWSTETFGTDELDRARSVARSMVVRLGEVAETGAQDPAAVVGPFVDTLLALRAQAREAKDFATADQVRDRLLAAGVEVRDGPDGTEWVLLP